MAFHPEGGRSKVDFLDSRASPKDLLPMKEKVMVLGLEEQLGRLADSFNRLCHDALLALEDSATSSRRRSCASKSGVSRRLGVTDDILPLLPWLSCFPAVRCSVGPPRLGVPAGPRVQVAARGKTDADKEDASPKATVHLGPSPAMLLGQAVHGGGLLARAAARGAITSMSAMLASGPLGQEVRAGACGLLAAMLTPMALAGGSAALVAGAPMMAFCPFPLSMPDGSGFYMCPTLPEATIKDLEKGILVATFVQGSVGLLKICLGDVFSGAYTLLLATLGYNSRHPGPASNWLKTYVLITFINGTMGSIDLIQTGLNQTYPLILATLPLSVNLLHAAQLTIPGISFLGAYCGWQHIKLQRKMAVDAYQQQVMTMMQQAPWPPPMLPFPLPGMPGVAGMPGMPGMPPGMMGLPGIPPMQGMPQAGRPMPTASGTAQKASSGGNSSSSCGKGCGHSHHGSHGNIRLAPVPEGPDDDREDEEPSNREHASPAPAAVTMEE